MLLFMRLEEGAAIFSLDDSDDTFASESVFLGGIRHCILSFSCGYPTLHFVVLALHCIGFGVLRALFALSPARGCAHGDGFVWH